MILERWF